MRRMTALLALAIGAGLLCTGCTSVKPWQKGRLALSPMDVKDCPAHRFERNTEVYREGAAGANGGKSGGGCGCS